MSPLLTSFVVRNFTLRIPLSLPDVIPDYVGSGSGFCSVEAADDEDDEDEEKSDERHFVGDRSEVTDLCEAQTWTDGQPGERSHLRSGWGWQEIQEKYQRDRWDLSGRRTSKTPTAISSTIKPAAATDLTREEPKSFVEKIPYFI